MNADVASWASDDGCRAHSSVDFTTKEDECVDILQSGEGRQELGPIGLADKDDAGLTVVDAVLDCLLSCSKQSLCRKK